jgi:hypothetical protein
MWVVGKVYVCNSSFMGDIGKRIASKTSPEQKA